MQMKICLASKSIYGFTLCLRVNALAVKYMTRACYRVNSLFPTTNLKGVKKRRSLNLTDRLSDLK